ncbi:hypothetical protein JCM21714_3488 [Gracilibacillus boraciitolerans JCM 21714]|uniref:Butyryl-CoA dehydrogenase n=1 Tax=Gracilibacillus boraciitolerans JCM 21714 TaxID=1298598 RepID=W4VLT6_9BACI|nr:hypothetical protein JCM21714_3488 [Gracilibacillus boraciitolerans JCM 21714]
MISEEIMKNDTLEAIIQEYLKPYVRKIDSEAYYAKKYLLELGKAGFYHSEQLSINEVLLREIAVVEKTAKYCMTTAFNLWCQLASMTYLRYSIILILRKKFCQSWRKVSCLAEQAYQIQ